MSAALITAITLAYTVVAWAFLHRKPVLRVLCRHGVHRYFHVDYQHLNFSFYTLTTECRWCGFRKSKTVGDRPLRWKVK